MDTNACRLFGLSVAQAIDNATDNNTRILEPGVLARGEFLHWAWQIKFEAAKNVAHVVDKMLHACGGSGYKRDMELERYLRDAKAGWVMGPTNEVLRQFVGKAVLLGFESLDYWNQTYNRRAVENELKKLDSKGKRELAEQLLAQAEEQAAKEPARPATGCMATATARAARPGPPPARPDSRDLPRAARRRRRSSRSRRATGSRSATHGGQRGVLVSEELGPRGRSLRAGVARAGRGDVRRRPRGASSPSPPRGEPVVEGGMPAIRPRARDAARAAARRARAGCPRPARRAAPRLRGRARVGARLRGRGGRVHPGDRREGEAVLRLPRLPHREAPGREGARASTRPRPAP